VACAFKLVTYSVRAAPVEARFAKSPFDKLGANGSVSVAEN
jgi:hypothetical protein